MGAQRLAISEQEASVNQTPTTNKNGFLLPQHFGSRIAGGVKVKGFFYPKANDESTGQGFFARAGGERNTPKQTMEARGSLVRSPPRTGGSAASRPRHGGRRGTPNTHNEQSLPCHNTLVAEPKATFPFTTELD